MSSDILKLSTKKSIHKPIEVDIDGVIYQNRPLSRSVFDEVKEYEKAALEGNMEALYKQLQIMFGIPMEILNNLDIRDVSSLLEYAMTKIFPQAAKTEKEKEEKNVSTPGPAKSA